MKTVRTASVLFAAVLSWGHGAVFASELDPVSAKAPTAILIQTDDQNNVVKAYAIQINNPRATLQSEENRAAVIAAQAKPENEITLTTTVTQSPSELDREGSTQAWYFNGFWGWNTGWVCNPYFNYTWYNWGNPWAFRGFRWNFFW